MKILLAEDQPILLKSLAFKLRKSGYDVITASDGLEAISLYHQEQPDLVITDLLMPESSGMQLIHNIRKNPKRAIPILVLSSIGKEEYILKAFDAGINDYVTKPFLPGVLVRRIQLLAESTPVQVSLS